MHAVVCTDHLCKFTKLQLYQTYNSINSINSSKIWAIRQFLTSIITIQFYSEKKDYRKTKQDVY